MSKFYICKMCGNLVEKVEDGGMAPYCCGKKMTCLNAEETEGSTEKHLPVTKVTKIPCGVNEVDYVSWVHIEVGSEPHPSQNNHYIKWIQLDTNKKTYRHYLQAGAAPATDFIICADEVINTVYSYCNIHGLWASRKITT